MTIQSDENASFGLVGHPLGHSWSPSIHESLGSAPYALYDRERDEAADLMREIVDPNCNIIFGASIDESLDDTVEITVIATGFQGNPSLIDRDERDDMMLKMYYAFRLNPENADRLKEDRRCFCLSHAEFLDYVEEGLK